jgi:hypothetical protein
MRQNGRNGSDAMRVQMEAVGAYVRCGARETREERLARATMACFVEARENTFSILTPLISSSTRPSSSAALRRVANRLTSRTRFFFDCDTVALLVTAASRSASCSSLCRVARIEHLRQMQSVRTSRRMYSMRQSSSLQLACDAGAQHRRCGERGNVRTIRGTVSCQLSKGKCITASV